MLNQQRFPVAAHYDSLRVSGAKHERKGRSQPLRRKHISPTKEHQRRLKKIQSDVSIAACVTHF